ncbi:MAG: type II toxin-antitoxin system prevent-host-death family antitoxin [Coriobacteriia bacterium]|nr:type II toxin-antitoxin system prevent-host-death family antitoxin [Coriobacteriia bacterium]
MDAIPYTTVRASLAEKMDRVCEDHAPIVVTRKANPSVVMISLDDYEALQETTYLLRSPGNTRRLVESIVRLESGEGAQRELAE